MSNVQPLHIDRAFAYATVNGKRVDIYPTHQYVMAFNALLQRTGGAYTDLIAAATATANQAAATAASAAVAAVAAYDAGAPTSFALDPASPIVVRALSAQTASAIVSAHTRTPAGGGAIALDAGSVDIARGVAYSIYYIDPTDAGGSVTYLATTDVSVAGDYAGGARIVGAAFLPVANDVWNGAGATP